MMEHVMNMSCSILQESDLLDFRDYRVMLSQKKGESQHDQWIQWQSGGLEFQGFFPAVVESF